MDARPRDLAVGMAQPGGQLFKLPLVAARLKAREIIEQCSVDGRLPVIENWRQLADGQIEFAVRYFAEDSE
jgi:hypothetical protein